MKVAVVGAGFWGCKHVEEYMMLPDVEVAAVVDPSVEARAWATLAGVPNTYARLDSMLKWDKVDAVSVCVNNPQHYSVADKCIRAGKHVLVEKPMTTQYRTSLMLVELAKERDVNLSVGHLFRFNNAIDRLRRSVRHGQFGDVYTIIGRWTTLCDPFQGRDVVTDLAPHAFDIMNSAIDEWPVSITANGKAYRRPGLEESAFITAEFPSGAMGHIEASWVLPGKVRTVELVGSDRAAHINALSQQMTVHEQDGSSWDAGIKANNTIQSELKHFTDCARRGVDSTNSGMIGANVVRCVEAAVQSMREKKTVYLEDWL